MPDQNNPSHQRFWGLLSKKLSNEITTEELAELHSILLKNPELHHRADMLSEMWQQKTENNCLENEAVYMRHIMKHKDEFFVEENPVETNGDVHVAETKPGQWFESCAGNIGSKSHQILAVWTSKDKNKSQKNGTKLLEPMN